MHSYYSMEIHLIELHIPFNAKDILLKCNQFLLNLFTPFSQMWLHYKILVFPWFWKSIGKLTRSHFSDRAASKLVMLDPKEFTSFPHCLFSSSAPRHYHVDCTLKLDVTKAFFSNLDQVRAARFGISFLDCSKLTVEFRIFPGCIDSPAGVVCCCWMHHSFYCGFPECFSWLNFRESSSILKL